MVQIWSLPQLVQLVNRMKTQDQVDHSINLFSMTERLLALEEAAPFRLNFSTFVDDAFSLDSSMFGLSSSCIADFLFTHFWRHKFASGAKGPVVLPGRGMKLTLATFLTLNDPAWWMKSLCWGCW